MLNITLNSLYITRCYPEFIMYFPKYTRYYPEFGKYQNYS